MFRTELAMRSTVADHVARFLVDRGVEQAFGLCGHTNISLLAALERNGGPRFVTARHEQVAAHAADGYARVTGRPGCAVVTAGPGTTDAVTLPSAYAGAAATDSPCPNSP